MYSRILLFFLIISTDILASQDIYIGLSAPLTGSNGFLGREIKIGIETALFEAKSTLNAKKNNINFIAMDDKYEPFYTARNMKRFAEDNNFIAVLGNVGTPTTKVALPIATQNNLPFIGAVTGSHILRNNPLQDNIINYRASYNEEMKAMIKAIFQAGISIDEIAFFTQDDDYGDSGYLAGIQALNLLDIDTTKIQRIPHGRYIRNTTYVEEGLNNIIRSKKDIKAFIMVGSYKPIAKFIKLAKEHYPSSYFFSMSFAGSEALKNELCINNKRLCIEYTHKVVITSVVPYLSGDAPIISEYKKALQSYLNSAPLEEDDSLLEFERKPNSISLEGYIIGKMFLLALDEAGQKPTRTSLLQAFRGLDNFDLGLGYTLNISSNNTQASSGIFPLAMRMRKLITFNWDDIRKTTKTTKHQLNQSK